MSALKKSILFGSNSLKVLVLCDMNTEKSFYYSLVWKEPSENVSIDINSGEVCSIVCQYLSEKVSI